MSFNIEWVANTVWDVIPGGISSDDTGNIYMTAITNSNSILYNKDDSIGAVGANPDGFYLATYDMNGYVVRFTRITRFEGTSQGRLRSFNASKKSNFVLFGGLQKGGSVTVEFTNSNGTTFRTFSINNTQIEGIVAKYNKNGDAMWIANISQRTMGFDPPVWGLESDDEFVYASGRINGNAIIPAIFFHGNGQQSSYVYNSTIEEDVFCAKYNSNDGSIVWVANIQGSSTNINADMSFYVVPDKDKNVYISGLSGGNTFIYNSNKTLAKTYIAATTTEINGYLVKYNSDGIVQWVTNVSGINNETMRPFAIKDNFIYVSGSIGNNSTFFHSNGSPFRTYSTGGMYIAKYDIGGNVIWTANIENASEVIDLTYSSNTIVISGIMNGGKFYNSNGTLATTRGSGSNYFLASYDTIGNFRWVGNINASLSSGYGHTYDEITGSIIWGVYINNHTIFYPNGEVARIAGKQGMTPIKISDNGVLVPPYNISVNPGYESASISFTGINNATNYDIFYTPTSGSTSTTEFLTTTGTITNLIPNTEYRIQIKSNNDILNIDSDLSSNLYVTPYPIDGLVSDIKNIQFRWFEDVQVANPTSQTIKLNRLRLLQKQSDILNISGVTKLLKNVQKSGEFINENYDL